MELAKDTLFIDSHQILLFSIANDTIRALTHKRLEGEKYKDEFLYNFKYSDFFDGKMPLKDKIKINGIEEVMEELNMVDKDTKEVEEKSQDER